MLNLNIRAFRSVGALLPNRPRCARRQGNQVIKAELEKEGRSKTGKGVLSSIHPN